MGKRRGRKHRRHRRKRHHNKSRGKNGVSTSPTGSIIRFSSSTQEAKTRLASTEPSTQPACTSRQADQASTSNVAGPSFSTTASSSYGNSSQSYLSTTTSYTTGTGSSYSMSTTATASIADSETNIPSISEHMESHLNITSPVSPSQASPLNISITSQFSNDPYAHSSPIHTPPSDGESAWEQHDTSTTALDSTIIEVSRGQYSGSKWPRSSQSGARYNQGAPQRGRYQGSSSDWTRDRNTPQGPYRGYQRRDYGQEPDSSGIIKVRSNHFELKLGNLKEVYQYDVTIKLTSDSKPETEEASNVTTTTKSGHMKPAVNYAVFNKWLQSAYPNLHPAFDGEKLMYCARKLRDISYMSPKNEITMEEGGRDRVYTIEINYSKSLKLAVDEETKVLPQEAVQCIDVVFQTASNEKYTQIGRSFFNVKNTSLCNSYDDGTRICSGFRQAFTMGDRPFLNVAINNKAFFREDELLDILLQFIHNYRNMNNCNCQNYCCLSKLALHENELVNKLIHNIKVKYKGINKPPHYYKINELYLTPEEAKTPDGQLTIQEYYKREKKVRIKYSNLPLIWVGSKKNQIYIPMEFCKVDDFQCLKAQSLLDQAKRMIDYSNKHSSKYSDIVKDYYEEVNYNNNKCVNEFGFSINDKFQEIEAKILKLPSSLHTEHKYRDPNDKQSTPRKIKWAYAIASAELLEKQRQIETFFKRLLEGINKTVLELESNPVKYNGIVTTQNQIVTCLDTLKRKDRCALIFIVLPEKNSEKIYAYVKTAAELKVGCITQCIRRGVALNEQRRRGIITNILLKIYSKMGGTNQFVHKDKLPNILKNIDNSTDVMIIGADVTHPTGNKGNSIAAVIASLDKYASRYAMKNQIQEPNQECIENLKAIVRFHLEIFHKKNRQLPTKIFYFRDGVGDSMFQTLLDTELKAIQDAYEDISKASQKGKLKITFVVVCKRHNTRLFPDSRYYARAPPGLCVDTTIVRPNYINFYMVSHESPQGVPRPTHYCVIQNDLELSKEQIEELTYYLCHMFARCTKSVSYPAPTYYAHIGATRGKVYTQLFSAEEKEENNINELNKKCQIRPDLNDEYPMFFV